MISLTDSALGVSYEDFGSFYEGRLHFLGGKGWCIHQADFFLVQAI